MPPHRGPRGKGGCAPDHGKVGAGMAHTWPGAGVMVACVRLVFRSYSACIPLILLDSFVREVVPSLGHHAHRRVCLSSGHGKPLLGMPLFAQVLAVMVSAGDELAVHAALRFIECFHGTILSSPGAARRDRQVALACTADRELNLNRSTECWTIPQDSLPRATYSPAESLSRVYSVGARAKQPQRRDERSAAKPQPKPRNTRNTRKWGPNPFRFPRIPRIPRLLSFGQLLAGCE